MTTTRKNEEGAVPRRGWRVALILWGLVLAGACITVRPTPAPVDQAKHTFTISYNTDSCPAKAVVTPKSAVPEQCAAGREDCVTVSREARPLIGFQQADAAPTSKAPFEIYFDPFRGSTFEGRSGAIPIGPGTAYGHYKFSVAGRGADGGECPALDPEIIVTQ